MIYSSDVIISRNLAVFTDSICSLVGYRHGSVLPREYRDQLINISSAMRKAYEHPDPRAQFLLTPDEANAGQETFGDGK